MQYSICSYSFRRDFEAGTMDIDGYIHWNKENGFTQLDPWMKHLEEGYAVGLAADTFLSKVKKSAASVDLPFGCIAVDGAHIYEPTAESRAANRQVAYRWIDIAGALGAPQVRIDAGGREQTLDEIFDIVVEGYQDIIDYAQDKNVEVIIENHWGPTKHPDHLVPVLEAVDGLGLLFDTNNWEEGTQEYAWEKCAKYARLTHIKTFEFDENGNEPSVNIPKAMKILLDAGYDGAWGIESCPRTLSEKEGATKTLELMKRVLGD
ncbi:sugar phosphate isomerase/epimerase [Chloroflexi bacterium TSY]|nr:sugar phosphate isomerase/epimerase [Chloroflexi bacterium TSY]